ncbi:dienelactone hydrolase family protein [Paracoccus sp. 11-3]|uniref:Dienelactone hydrolase family protein n=1 Tax=Paracoccus amoyensis TaxID=2760093 RepID=A0A926GCN0_9RHOB|nr:dienelactone hydrolase family protein [Paracoccus amoyensis]MBC9247551.1 dienelactone hydrolase family protein [Paracoccus amoyensis]
MLDDNLEDFETREITFDAISRRVHVGGQGPAVIVMPEMPGLSPQVIRFGRWVRDAGFSVWMPSLFGADGAEGTADAGARVFKRACVAAEFRALAGQGSSPITSWLRALAKLAHRECGGPGAGAVGMCFTGNFALSMMLEPSMLAPVLCQPALPLDDPEAVESPPDELAQIRDRLHKEDLSVLAWRFAGDPFCRAGRFAAYEVALGAHFDGRVLPDTAANPDPPPFFREHVPAPHSVMTAHLIDQEGELTQSAVEETIAFLKRRLKPKAMGRGGD